MPLTIGCSLHITGIDCIISSRVSAEYLMNRRQMVPLSRVCYCSTEKGWGRTRCSLEVEALITMSGTLCLLLSDFFFLLYNLTIYLLFFFHLSAHASQCCITYHGLATFDDDCC